MSGTHITLESFKFTTLALALNCASFSASLTITGWRLCSTRSTIESESRSTAFWMSCLWKLRATSTRGAAVFHHVEEPLAAGDDPVDGVGQPRSPFFRAR